MGKTSKSKSNDGETTSEQKIHTKKPKTKTNKTTEAREIGKALRQVELPKSADGLTAEKLSADQKMIFKKECQNLYGHRYSARRALPAHSIESATSQLEARMREKAKQLKEKKMKKKTEQN